MQFVAEHGTDDVLQHPKVVAKMAKPVRRTKEMLSANTEAPFMVEELYKGIDFASSITRDEFETIAGEAPHACTSMLYACHGQHCLGHWALSVQHLHEGIVAVYALILRRAYSHSYK